LGLLVNNPNITPSPTPSPKPSPKPCSVPPEALAPLREPITFELESNIDSTVAELVKNHAAAGFDSGSPITAKYAIGEVLIGAVNAVAILADIRRAHALWVPHWQARVKAKPTAFVPWVAKFVSAGDYLRPPAPVEPKVSKTVLWVDPYAAKAAS